MLSACVWSANGAIQGDRARGKDKGLLERGSRRDGQGGPEGKREGRDDVLVVSTYVKHESLLKNDICQSVKQ